MTRFIKPAPYTARAYVAHAPGEEGRALCGTLIRRGHPVAGADEPVTCNRCQRAIAKPVHDRNRKKPRPRARRFSGQRRFETKAELEQRSAFGKR